MRLLDLKMEPPLDQLLESQWVLDLEEKMGAM